MTHFHMPALPLHTSQPLQPLHPTLHAYPAPAHMLNEHAHRRCGCVLPEMGYYALRHLLAKLLHLGLMDFVESLLKKEGELNSPDNQQFWQISQPI